MRVLVTGATGIIGRRAVPELLRQGHAVTAAGRDRERLAALSGAGAATMVLDVFDPARVRKAAAGHDAVVNLATHIPGTGLRAFLPGAWAETDRLRKVASAVLADAVISCGIGRFVQESFALTYPDSGGRCVDEAVAPWPARYNRTALDAERSAERVTAAGLTGVVLRFSLFYGAPEDGFTSDVLRYVRRGWLPLFGRPDGYVSMVHHDDAARAVVAALDAPAGIYNVVDDEPLTRRDLAIELGRIAGVGTPRLPPPWVAALGGSLGRTIARSLRLSNARLRAAGWAPRFPSGREGWRAAYEARGMDGRAHRQGGTE